jgi:hypothetical protein
MKEEYLTLRQEVALRILPSVVSALIQVPPTPKAVRAILDIPEHVPLSAEAGLDAAIFAAYRLADNILAKP